MKKFLKVLNFTFIYIIFLTSSSSLYAATTVDYNTSAPSSTKVSDSFCSEYVGFSCNNGPTIGDPAGCGNVCDGGSVWTRHTYSGCYADPDFPGDYRAWAAPTGDSCSTADKYNDRYNEGDTTMLRAGGCLCETRQLYKTCCNGANAVGTYQAGGNPEFPDGGCSYTTTPCGSDRSIYDTLGYEFKNVSCGQSACQAYFATPTPTPKYSCNFQTFTCSQDTNGTYTDLTTCSNNCKATACPTTEGWTGQSCSGPSSPNISQPCASDTTTCNKCSVAVCTQYDPSTNLYCYFNSGACYIDATNCQGFGNCAAGRVCTPNTTRVRCDNSTCAVPAGQ